MMQLFLEWWSDRLQGQLIPIDGKPYMERYYVRDISLRFFKWRFRRSIYLHCILMGDTDQGLHNHPWPGFSIILSGFYRELRLSRPIYPGDLMDQGYIFPCSPLRFISRYVWLFNRLGPHVFHRIIMDGRTSARVDSFYTRPCNAARVGVRLPTTFYG